MNIKILYFFINILILVLLINCNNKPSEYLLNGEFINTLEIKSISSTHHNKITVEFSNALDENLIKDLSSFSIIDETKQSIKIKSVSIGTTKNRLDIQTENIYPKTTYTFIVLKPIGIYEQKNPPEGLSHSFETYYELLSIKKITTTSLDTMKIEFNLDLDATLKLQIENYSITDSKGNSYKISQITAENDPKSVKLNVENLTSNTAYTLKILNTIAENNIPFEKTGLSSNFTSFNIVTEQRYISISISDGFIYNKTSFIVSLTAKRGVDESIITDFTDDLDITIITGNGTLKTINKPGFKDGIQDIELQYEDNIEDFEISNLILTFSSKVNPDVKGTTSNIIVLAKLVTTHFEITTSTNEAKMNENIQLTIKALDRNEDIVTDYKGTIDISTSHALFNISPIQASGFTNGILTTSVAISSPHIKTNIIVKDHINPKILGISNQISIKYDGSNIYRLDLAAVSVSATTIRLTWSPITNADKYLIYKGTTFGTYSLIHTENDENIFYYKDLGVTTGTTYYYKIEAIDSSSQVLKTEYSYCKASAGTTITINTGVPSISSVTTWKKENSPYHIKAGTGNIFNIKSSLTIEPGTHILIESGNTIAITIEGGMFIAIGNNEERIIITSESADPTKNDWSGIYFNSGTPSYLNPTDYSYVSGSALHFCTIEFGTTNFGCSIPIQAEKSVFRFALNTSTGATMNSDSSLYLKSCVYAHNEGSRGACIFLWKSDDCILDSCIFYANKSNVGTFKSGGAIYLMDHFVGDITIKNNFFIENNADNSSGAIEIPNSYSGNSLTISNNVFLDNSSPTAGAIQIDGSFTNVLIKQNTFKSNRATSGNAGAISLIPNSGAITVTRNNFINNSATAEGGAISIAAGNAGYDLSHNSYTGNTSSGTGFNIYNGITQTHNATDSYFNSLTDKICPAGRNALGVVDNCNSGSGTITLTDIASTAWTLCGDNPSEPSCVGSDIW